MNSTPCRSRIAFAWLGFLLCIGVAGQTTAKPNAKQPVETLSEPGVRFVFPRPRQQLVGVLPLQLEVGAPDRLKTLQFGVLGQRLKSVPAKRWTIVLDSAEYSNGPKIFVVRATYHSGVIKSASLPLTVANPKFEVLTAVWQPERATSGAPLRLDLEFSERPKNVAVDFGPIDSEFNTDRVHLATVFSENVQLDYDVSVANRRPAGKYSVVVSAESRAGRKLKRSIPIELNERTVLRQFPLVVTHCEVDGKRSKVLRFELPFESLRLAVGPASGQTAPLVRLFGEEELVIGSPSAAQIQLTLPEEVAQPQRSPYLVIRVLGYDGYYRCELPRNARRATLGVGLTTPRTETGGGESSAPLPERFQLEVGVEYGGTFSAWAKHEYRVRPAGWLRAWTEEEKRRAREKAERRRQASSAKSKRLREKPKASSSR